MDHDNLVVVHFNEFAGGKFFINCLSHHRQVLPGIDLYYRHLNTGWSLDDLDDDQIERIKIEAINGTIPPKSDLRDWCRFELGCQNFWGTSLWQLLDRALAREPFTGGVKALQRYICFIINHQMSMQQYRKIQTLWPRARHIILHNSDRFRQSCIQYKSHRTYLIGSNALDMDLPGCFYVDVDQTWGDLDRIKTCVQGCIHWLGLESDMNDNLDHYIQHYISVSTTATRISRASS